jgi:hypothetical protein
MRLRPDRLVVVLLLSTIFLWSVAGLTAADSPPASEEEIRRQAQEVERLQKELQRAQSDLQKLESENQRLRQEKTNPPSKAAPTSAEPAKPVAAIATLPPLEPGQIIEVSALVAQFLAEPEAAGRRYTKKEFRVQGTVAGFDPWLLTRNYTVRLDSPERRVVVTCQFHLPDRYTAVYTKHSGQTLVGKLDERTEAQLLQVGDPVTIEGKCKGLKKGELSFTGCQVVK